MAAAVDLELESSVRHLLQRQMHLVQLCEQECEAAVSRTNASIAEAILLLQARGTQLVAATRTCYSQAKVFHSDLHSQAAALLAQIHTQPAKSQVPSENTVDYGARFLKISEDARASPLCIGCGGLGVIVDLSDVTNAISDLQVNVTESSYPMPVIAEVDSVSPNAAEISWKFVPELSSLEGRGVCVIRVTECPSLLAGEGVPSADAMNRANVDPSCYPYPPFSLSFIATESPCWIDGLSPSTRYSLQVGGMPAPKSTRKSRINSLAFGTKNVDIDFSSAWAWSSEVQFETPSISENVIRRVSDGVMMKDGQIILSEGAGISSGSTWSVFTVGDLCSHRRAFVFKLGGRCDKVAVGFCFPGSSPGQEEILMKRLQSSGWQQPEFFGVLGCRIGIIGGSLPSAKPSFSPHFVKAQCSTVESVSKIDDAVDPIGVVALSCSVTDGFLSLAAWVRSSCVMWVESTHVTARAVVLVYGQQSSVTLLR